MARSKKPDPTQPYSGVVGREQDERGRLIAPGIQRPGDAEPVRRVLPPLTSLKPSEMSKAETWRALEAYQVVPTGPGFRAATGQWLGRMWALPPGSPRVKEELDKLYDGELSNRMLTNMARRASEQYTTMAALEGDPNAELVRIPEDFDDERICDRCADLAGETGTYAFHAGIGLPGAASCYGGDACRCTLVAVG